MTFSHRFPSSTTATLSDYTTIPNIAIFFAGSLQFIFSGQHIASNIDNASDSKGHKFINSRNSSGT